MESGKAERLRAVKPRLFQPRHPVNMTVPKSLQPRHPVCVIQNTPHRTRHTGHATRSPFPRPTRSSTPLSFSLALPTTSAKSQPFTQRQEHHASEHLPHLLAADQRHSNAPAPVSPYKTITDPPLALFMDPTTTSLISARRRNLSWSLVNAQKACRPFQTSDLQNQASSCSSRTATSSLGVVIVLVGVVVSIRWSRLRQYDGSSHSESGGAGDAGTDSRRAERVDVHTHQNHGGSTEGWPSLRKLPPMGSQEGEFASRFDVDESSMCVHGLL